MNSYFVKTACMVFALLGAQGSICAMGKQQDRVIAIQSQEQSKKVQKSSRCSLRPLVRGFGVLALLLVGYQIGYQHASTSVHHSDLSNNLSDECAYVAFNVRDSSGSLGPLCGSADTWNSAEAQSAIAGTFKARKKIDVHNITSHSVPCHEDKPCAHTAAEALKQYGFHLGVW